MRDRRVLVLMPKHREERQFPVSTASHLKEILTALSHTRPDINYRLYLDWCLPAGNKRVADKNRLKRAGELCVAESLLARPVQPLP